MQKCALVVLAFAMFGVGVWLGNSELLSALLASAHGDAHSGLCPEVSVDFAIVSYSTPIPRTLDDGIIVTSGPREEGSRVEVQCFTGFSLKNHGYLECQEGEWVGTAPECVHAFTHMQLFVLFSFGAVAVFTVLGVVKTVIDYRNKKHIQQQGRKSNVGGIDGAIFRPNRASIMGTMSVAEMGNNISAILTFETFTLFLGFSEHFRVFIQDGVWYLNPTQYTMKNPGQSQISLHVVFGFTICVVMGVMASLIKYGSYGGPLRRTHKFLGKYVIPPVALCFLLSAVRAELMLPGSIPQKIARNMLVVWCVIVLYLVVKTALTRQIAAHLHYLVAFWGLVCSAGSLRGMGLFLGWLNDCKWGYGANPTWGILLGPFFSTLAPMLYFVRMCGTWHKPYARKAIFFAAFYQLLLPVYFKNLADPCYPRANLHEIYHDYKFLLPSEFYKNTDFGEAIASLGY